jgi:fructose/tagatose bisphosphate aldolase
VLIPFPQLLAERADGTAVGAFTVYDMETTAAVLHAADAAEAGVIMETGRMIGSKVQSRSPTKTPRSPRNRLAVTKEVGA